MIVPGPEPFSAYTTPEFWDDPHISAQMLRHHLDPDSDASSRSHAFIERSVVWLVGLLSLREGSRVLDLGCGPGLYALGLARLGARVVGVDVSRRSLGHLLEASAAENLPIETVHGSYLEADLDGPHDAAILIYEDYCALNPAQRHLLLTRVREALRPGGQLVFDVTAAPAFPVFDGSVDDVEHRVGEGAGEPGLPFGGSALHLRAEVGELEVELG